MYIVFVVSGVCHFMVRCKVAEQLIVGTNVKVTCKCLVHVDPLSRSNFCENNLAVMSVSIPLTWDKHRNIALLYFGAPNGNKSFWKINTASDCSQIVSTNSDKLQLVLIVLYLCVRKCFAKCGRGKAVYELSRLFYLTCG